MAEEQPNFEHLSTAEVKRLYQQTRQAALKERGIKQAQVQAQNDLGIEGEYYRDGFGKLIEGVKPPTKQDRYYVSSEGYVVELKEGEQAPVSQGATLLDKVTTFVNQNVEDPDIKELLPEDLSVFEEQSADFPDYYLLGTLRGKKWYVTALNEKDDARAFKFVLSHDLDREHAIAAAHSYLETRVGPKFRELSPTDINMIQRLSINNRELALELYLKAKLPKEWAQEMTRLAAQVEVTGDNLRLLQFMSNPAIASTLEEAIYSVWFWHQPHIEESAELQAFFESRTADTVLTFSFLDKVYSQFQMRQAVNHLGSQSAADAGPSQEDLENLSGKEVEELYQKTRVELARSRR